MNDWPPLLGPPDKLRISAEGKIEHIGRLADGTQFMAFITGAVPDGYVFNLDNEDWRQVKRWLGVLHLFDALGNHVHSDIRLGGYDIEGWDDACGKAWTEVRNLLAPHRAKKPQTTDIWVKTFSFVRDGITHGLIYQVHEADEYGPAFESVMLQPRDLMFHPPWDSGEWSS